MGDNPLIKLDELTKPATVLVEKISEAIGGMFKPWQIVRVAKAEAAADRIRAESNIQITDLQQRAMRRFLVEEGKKQANIEEITTKALPLLSEESKPQDVSDDWITNFFDKCRIVSDSEMQQLWSRILAGEANNPGRFSRQTVNLLSNLERGQAELFENLCGFGWKYGGYSPVLFPLVCDVRDAVYSERGIFYGGLLDLESLGLVKVDLYKGFTLRNQPERVTAAYFGTAIELTLSSNQREYFGVGQAVLTQAGQELAQVCAPKRVEGLLEYAIKHWNEEKMMPRTSEQGPRPSSS
jgi:hypothetical protein